MPDTIAVVGSKESSVGDPQRLSRMKGGEKCCHEQEKNRNFEENKNRFVKILLNRHV